MSSTYISVADTAKEIRKALKATFPTIKFSVRSKGYSGGASVDVSWTDGPTSKQVDAIVGQFAGASFDGMQDLKSHHDSEYNGQMVSWGADYVCTTRNYSVEFMQRRADDVAARYGMPAPKVYATSYGSIMMDEDYQYQVCGDTLVHAIRQKAHRTSAAV